MLLLIDNYDSFTYNLAQYLGELGADVHVHRNDAINLEQINAWRPERIVIRPNSRGWKPRGASTWKKRARDFSPRKPSKKPV